MSAFEMVVSFGVGAGFVLLFACFVYLIKALRQLEEAAHSIDLLRIQTEDFGAMFDAVNQIRDFSKSLDNRAKGIHANTHDLYEFSDKGLAPFLAAHAEAFNEAIQLVKERQTVHVQPQPYPEPSPLRHMQQDPQVVTWDQLRAVGEQRRQREEAERQAAEQKAREDAEYKRRLMEGMAKKAPMEPGPIENPVPPDPDPSEWPSANKEGRRMTTGMDDVFRKIRGEGGE